MRAKTSIDKCSGDDCICKRRPKPLLRKIIDEEVALKVWPRLAIISSPRTCAKTISGPSIPMMIFPPDPLKGRRVG